MKRRANTIARQASCSGRRAVLLALTIACSGPAVAQSDSSTTPVASESQALPPSPGVAPASAETTAVPIPAPPAPDAPASQPTISKQTSQSPAERPGEKPAAPPDGNGAGHADTAKGKALPKATGKTAGKAGAKAAGSADTSTCSAAQTKLAFDLIAALAEKSSGETVIVSPASLAAALAAIDRGADKPMKDAIRRTLRFGNADDALGCLRKWMETPAAPDGPLQSANRVVLSKIALPKGDAVKEHLKADGVMLSAEDLSRSEGIAEVNGWVKKQTNGAIPVILPAPISDAGLVALNVLRFKAAWQTVFDRDGTKPATFTSLGGALTVQMMSLPEGEYSFRKDDRFVAVDLPFDGERFTMTIVTTNTAPAAAADFRDAAGWLDPSAFEYLPGTVKLPQIALDGDHDLLPALNGLGLADGQKSPGALKDFGPGIRLGSVLQRVRFQADEEGALAAAATAAIASRGIRDTVRMVVDKPFLFAIRDTGTGLILVAGYVSKPTAEACAEGASGPRCGKPPG